MRITLHDRLWAVIAHVPVVTIIWVGYLVYSQLVCGCDLSNLLNKYKTIDWHILPFTPIILTLLSVPIALGIQRMQRSYPLARNNAHQAYLFNIWLLQWYAVMLCLAVFGLYFQYVIAVWAAGILGCIVGLNCLVQAMLGIRVAWKGKVYCYWRLGRK